jgi:hypothetical protein
MAERGERSKLSVKEQQRAQRRSRSTREAEAEQQQATQIQTPTAHTEQVGEPVTPFQQGLSKTRAVTILQEIREAEARQTEAIVKGWQEVDKQEAAKRAERQRLRVELESRLPGISQVKTPPEPPKTRKQRLEEQKQSRIAQKEREEWLEADQIRDAGIPLVDEERGGDDRWVEHHAEAFDRSLKPETQVNIVPDKNQGRRPHRVSSTVQETHQMISEEVGGVPSKTPLRQRTSRP